MENKVLSAEEHQLSKPLLLEMKIKNYLINFGEKWKGKIIEFIILYTQNSAKMHFKHKEKLRVMLERLLYPIFLILSHLAKFYIC